MDRSKILPMIYLAIFMAAMIFDLGPWRDHDSPRTLLHTVGMPATALLANNPIFHPLPRDPHYAWAGTLQDAFIGMLVNVFLLSLLNKWLVANRQKRVDPKGKQNPNVS